MRFLVDAQLPPKLAEWLRERGHEASHVRDLALAAEQDVAILAEALSTGSIIVTKDADFSHLSASQPGCKVVWIRFGNATSRDLLRQLEPVFGDVESALAAGQTLVVINR